MMATGKTWIVVLDDLRARFLRLDAPPRWTGGAPEIASDLNKARPEERRIARAKLLQQAMAVVDGACDRNQCERIVVVAPERLLRSFRAVATDRVRVRLWRERAAETASLTDEEIVQSLEGYFRSVPG
ncbi:MAG: hypothetical protein ACJ8IR_13105 [Alphaproteobacteria bacterium]|jgi:hypothetical protein